MRRRCAMRSNGRRVTRSGSHDESLGRAHPRHLLPDCIFSADDESAEAVAHAAEEPAARTDSDIDDPLNRHKLAVVVLFLVAGAWGATFTLIKSILVLIAPEPFIFWRF